MAELKCKLCGHSRRMHSIDGGCTHSGRTLGRCLCNVKFMDKKEFEMGEPNND